MKRLLSVCLIFWLGATCSSAGPAEAAIVAIMRLSDQANYSWVATVSDDARTYDIFGQTIRGGFTQVKMPLINTVRRKLGRSMTDTQIDLIFRGNVDCVIDTDDGWQRPSELPMLPWNSAEQRRSRGTTVRGPIVGSALGQLPGPAVHMSKVADRKAGGILPYSNLQLGITHPHEELGVIVASHYDLNVQDNIVTGALTDLGAQLLLVRDGQKYITPVSATGTFKLWLRDGMVAKYQVTLEGTLNIHLQSGRRQVGVHQVTNTMIKDVGTTMFDVPAQARLKLDR